MTNQDDSPKILVVDDVPANVRLLEATLLAERFEVITASNGIDALVAVKVQKPDLILLDIAMPEMSGIDVCEAVRRDEMNSFLPIILVTALDPRDEMVRGLAAGADDFVSKPFIAAELIARVRSLLRVKRLYDQVQNQAETIQRWNDDLQTKVSQQVEELQRVRRVQRFLSPQVAQAVLADDGAILKSHRREIVVVYLDLRGFTAFSETAEPEDVMQSLSEYHAAMGSIAMRFNGTIERFTGDAIMVFLNDPIPIEQPAVVACEMANAMRDAAQTLTQSWQQRGFTLGLGIGVAQGYATVGTIGFEARQDYAAIGSVTNMSARLCAEAQANEILMTERVFNGASYAVVAEPLGLVTLKGFSQPQSLMRLISFQRPD